MRIDGIPVGQLTAERMQSLVASRVGESHTLEFKLMLPGQSTDDKREFLADITALANTAGGVILYGIATERDASGNDTGVAARIAGLPGINCDKEKQRLSAMAHDGIAPSLAAHIALQDVPIPGAEGVVMALGVSRSLARPHMVTFNQSGRFWRRSDVGKYRPDVAELRAMFLETQSWVGQAEAFRDQRVERVVHSAVIPSLNVGSSLFVHVLPLGRLDAFLDLASRESELRTHLPPPSYGGYSHRFNADGFLTYTAPNGVQVDSYTQWFRFGGVEGYDSGIVASIDHGTGRQMRQFWAQHVCDTIRDWTQKALAAIRDVLDTDPPYVVLISICAVADAVLVTERSRLTGYHAITDNELRLPPIVIETLDIDIAARLTPLLDIVWQAGGYARAPERKS